MNRSALCLGVSVRQVILVIILWWYAPREFVSAVKAAKAKYPNQKTDPGLDFTQRITPVPAERISIVLNFPVAVLASPFNFIFPRPLYEGNLRLLLAFTVPPSDGSSTLTLAPTSITMLVGDTHAIMATNAQGQPVMGLAWSSSDNTIVSLSNDDPPILTAVDAGRADLHPQIRARAYMIFAL